MGDWMGVVVAVAIGVPLLLLAVWVDARRRRRMDEELASAPLRGDPRVDALIPGYVTQEAVDALPRPGGSQAPPPGPAHGVRMGFGHLDPDFATDGGVAALTDAAVLMVGDDVETMRELLGPLATATPERPLVIVASAFHPDVLASLKANRRVTHLPVVAVAANPAELMQLQDLVGGEVLSSADLKAGWLPSGAWGRALSWRSDMASTHVVGDHRPKG
ncbi:hypothetical protein [Tessaracoccus antarcticus]|uniref:Uncharacterized protein n=1 Tax=Tessaracoccus antarcticus TaxID=2479848 RepID=A0A3M0GB50_9ACTN|nr:hypothetical protein [Tessaracoccus antarcticus]RMB58209.1 hypothetical protein EAX62_13435 [Tessaracoccus antarcticus]